MSEKFPRRNWFRFKKLGTKWRRPKGGQNKVRMGRKGRPLKPKPGHGSPRAERFFVNGFKPIMINNVNDIERVNENEIAVISSKLGLKSVLEISKKAKTKGVKIFNNRRAVKAEKVMLNKKRAKEALKKKENPKKDEINVVDKNNTPIAKEHNATEKHSAKKQDAHKNHGHLSGENAQHSNEQNNNVNAKD